MDSVIEFFDQHAFCVLRYGTALCLKQVKNNFMLTLRRVGKSMANAKKKWPKGKPEAVIMAEYVWSQTKGADFHPDDLDHGEMQIKKTQVKDVVAMLMREKYLTSKGGEKPCQWTEAAKMIKAQGGNFIKQQPASIMKEVDLAGVAAVVDGALGETGSSADLVRVPAPGADRPPGPGKPAAKSPAPRRRKSAPEKAGPQPPADLPAGPSGPSPEVEEVAAVAAAEEGKPPQVLTDIHGILAGAPEEIPEVIPQAPAQVLVLPSLFLNPAEANALRRFSEAPKPLRLSWLLDIGLGDGDGLAHFLQKLTNLGIIIAQVPDQAGEQDVVFFLDTVKLPYYLKKRIVFDPEAAEKELIRQQEELAGAQAEMEARREGKKEALRLAEEVVTLRQTELEKIQRQLKEAESHLQKAEQERDRVSVDLQTLEGEIAANDFPRKIQSLKDRQEVAGQESLLNSLEMHELMTLSLAMEGKEG